MALIGVGAPGALDDLEGTDGLIRLGKEESEDFRLAVGYLDIAGCMAQATVDGIELIGAGDDDIGCRNTVSSHLADPLFHAGGAKGPANKTIEFWAVGARDGETGAFLTKNIEDGNDAPAAMFLEFRGEALLLVYREPSEHEEVEGAVGGIAKGAFNVATKFQRDAILAQGSAFHGRGDSSHDCKDSRHLGRALTQPGIGGGGIGRFARCRVLPAAVIS